ncbi:hypothetical protein AB0M45_27435 [Nocardia sp. NPDC051787]|uniref:hypothetical protein n=1 Tax=Nocardia sp. NPDC051787 TaxID=3155415 RepID=UPI0034201465
MRKPNRTSPVRVASRKTIALSAQTDDPVGLLLDQVERAQAEAVIVPGRVHLDGHIGRVMRRAVSSSMSMSMTSRLDGRLQL